LRSGLFCLPFSHIYFCFRLAFMLYLLAIINLITFAAFAMDKWKAVKHRRRISEFSLLTMTFFGGTAGAVLAMLIFRHKVSKKSFLIKFLGIVVLQIGIFLGCWKLKVGCFGGL
jgi:uncharacterized membrane protein YsdA (DUF1294 family)